MHRASKRQCFGLHPARKRSPISMRPVVEHSPFALQPALRQPDVIMRPATPSNSGSDSVIALSFSVIDSKTPPIDMDADFYRDLLDSSFEMPLEGCIYSNDFFIPPPNPPGSSEQSQPDDETVSQQSESSSSVVSSSIHTVEVGPQTAYEMVATEQCTSVAGVSTSQNLIQLFPRWKYTREQLVDFIRKQKYSNYSCESYVPTCRVYWLGLNHAKFLSMLTEVEYVTYMDKNLVSIEAESHLFPRTNFINCSFFTPRCLSFFRRTMLSLPTIFVAMNAFTRWTRLHDNFNQHFADCLGVSMDQKPVNCDDTVRKLLFSYLVFEADNLLEVTDYFK